MKNSLDNFELILVTISDGIVVVDAHGLVLYANDSANRIFERGELLGKDLAVPLYPSQGGQDINLIRRSGIGWAELRSAPLTWNKQPAYVIGVRDITERKLADLKLKLADAVFDSTREGLLVTDHLQRIVRINPAFSEITGYSEAEVLGQTPQLLNSGRHDRLFYQTMWASINGSGHWQGEIWNRRKNGEVYPQLISIDAIRDANGQVCNYVAVSTDLSKLRDSELELDFLAHHDPLTRLPNRLLLLSRLQHGIDLAQRDGTPLALLMIDLDRFKDINDSLGHLAGDELLQSVASRLSTQAQGVDTVSRFGGDEFALLQDVDSAEQVASIANDIIRFLSEPYHLSSGVEVRIGASVGISIFSENALTPELMLQQADSALYQAKTEGRGRFAYFCESQTQAARARVDIEVRLRRAITQGELRVYYQPQVDIASGRIVGAEALVRWQSPEGGLIQPARFIPIAESTGLIGEIDDWVLRETCLQGQRWRQAGLPELTLAVNVSAYQFSQGDMAQTVARVLHETGYPAQWLELELTESALMQRETQAIEFLNRLKALGVRLAIDDFGTGYSSLAYLKLFALDVLKIDKRFIDDIPVARDDMEIVTAIIGMAHALRLKVLAEGVENNEQLAYLTAQGCDQFQGYLTSRPVPAAEFEKLLGI
ncbi:MAG: GGDEF domain-containing protein [Comamonadaceae bacterium CG_4_9_14_3_um_filter_60_33]|nr:MAG: GGDEF domain-containing protein [Comamonadaceae bacterium CG2_30_59_20]PIY27793.1 MAG: GGDEF domain-containing protein [Comamonadaceae bacterium CG_4_10_14_3_um_filter_60_42]PJB46627.1 MAG: GGDEF domain-containing protein [Comamonadaceae bacterium CG_4_9_14_3_um_filter_60_33]